MSLECNVVIVGAGMAGLGAAQQLAANKIDFLILEAQENAGGRIKTMHVNDNIIELGAQWLHGVDTPLHEIAVKYDLIAEETSDEGLGLYIRNDGYVFDDFFVKKIDFEIGKILARCEEFVDCEIYPRSVGDFMEEQFSIFLNDSEYNEQETIRAWELYDWHVRFQLIDNSCGDLKDLSAREWGKYSCLGKDGQAHINLKGGYGNIVNILVRELPESCILYGIDVDKIEFNENTQKVVLRSGSKTILCDHVILTVSLGVLKDLEIKFDLPQEVNSAMDAIGFSGIGKVFLMFETKWWKDEGFQLIWKRGENTNWTKHFSGFDNVLHQPNMLLGWLSAAGIDEMEKLSEQQVGIDCVDLLRNFLSKDDIPYPIKIYKTLWKTCQFIRGGYSYATPMCDLAKVTQENLCKPIFIKEIPRLLIAGEATHVSHFSTTHGAYEAGQQQAEFLVKYICGKQT